MATRKPTAKAPAGKTAAAARLGNARSPAPEAVTRVQNQQAKLQAKNVKTLLERLREDRVLHEETFTNAYALSPDLESEERIDPESAFEEAKNSPFASADMRDFALVGAARGLASEEVVKRVGSTVVVAAAPSTLLALRRAHPGIPVKRLVWAYPQYVHTLREELDDVDLAVVVKTRGKSFKVQLSHLGQPLPGVKVSALLDWNGANVPAVTDGNGVAIIKIPPQYPRVEMIYAEPEHSYWPLYQDGFDRSTAPRMLKLDLQPLTPDGFQLLGHYAKYKPDAGFGVKVGVIDTGVGPHKALRVKGGACLVTGENPTDFSDNGVGHGTHVAGIIAAEQIAGTGIWGLAPACTLMSYRVCPSKGERGRAQSSDIAAALQQAIADQCDIINISMGSLEAMPDVPDLLKRARSAGAVVFAATGNDGKGFLRYPARYPEAVAVAAMGRDGTFPLDCPEWFQESELRVGQEFVAEFSNYGIPTDFIAPGVAVLSTFPNDRYAMMSGTSMATPFIAGMAARLLSKNGSILNSPRSAKRSDDIMQLLSQQHIRRIGWSVDYEGFGVVKE